MLQSFDVVVAGAGVGGLTTACLMAHSGLKVLVLERNWLPGGCVSTYPRKHFQFEAGATTLMGLEEGMPMRHLLDTIKVQPPVVRLEVPMQVRFADGEVLTRHEDFASWVGEATRAFGGEAQPALWRRLKDVSDFVWRNALRQRAFPPRTWGDLKVLAGNASAEQVLHLPLAFRSTADFLRRQEIPARQKFDAFAREQLMITAQNEAEEVNLLFGAAALCYTLYPNYYVMGGMINLIRPLVSYLESQGSQVVLREGVKRVNRTKDGYEVITDKGTHTAKYFVSGVPLNNTLDFFEEKDRLKSLTGKVLESEALASAFSMGVAFRRRRDYDTLHHQLHLAEPLPQTGSGSLFVSLSYPEDRERCGPDEVVASISTHIPDPAGRPVTDKAQLEQVVLAEMEKHGLLKREDVIFYHSSTQKSWEKWTGRRHGFVGGYPQYMRIKPWQMQDARLDRAGAYLCGDSTYPGQGIPGACLSGILAFEKWKMDWGKF
jgi:phytoene dehydrogenase-like protein